MYMNNKKLTFHHTVFCTVKTDLMTRAYAFYCTCTASFDGQIYT